MKKWSLVVAALAALVGAVYFMMRQDGLTPTPDLIFPSPIQTTMPSVTETPAVLSPSISPQPSVVSSPSPAPSVASSSPTNTDMHVQTYLHPTPQNMKDISSTVGPTVWANLDNSGIWVLEFKLPKPVPPGAIVIATYDISSNVKVNVNDRNIKFGMRNSLGPITTGCLNDYICTQKSGNPEFTTEQVLGNNGITAKFDPKTLRWNNWTRAYFPWPDYTVAFRTETLEYDFPSGVGRADGAVRFRAGGKDVFAADHWQADDAAHPGTRDTFRIQLVYANQASNPLPTGSFWVIKNPKLEVYLP